MPSIRKLCLGLGVGAAAGQFLFISALRAGPADPESAPAGLEEIVVTATRRQERLQDVPISVSHSARTSWTPQGLKNIDDLSRLSPGLNFQRNGMSSSGNYNDESSDINIRGVDSTAGTSTTGIYIDDTPIQTRHIGFGSINAFPALFDLDHVEVLRGPQGTLFGAGAEGGVVRFITPEPDLNKTEHLRTRRCRRSPTAALRATRAARPSALRSSTTCSRSAPASPSAATAAGSTVPSTPSCRAPRLRCRRRYTTASPPRRTRTTGDTTTARFALKWKVNDSLEIMPSFYYQHLQIADTSAYWVSLSNPDSNIYRTAISARTRATTPSVLTLDPHQVGPGLRPAVFQHRLLRPQPDRPFGLHAISARDLEFLWRAPEYLSGARRQWLRHRFRTINAIFIRSCACRPRTRIPGSYGAAGLFYSRLSENVPENIYDSTLNQEVINYTAPFPARPLSGVYPQRCGSGMPGGLDLQRAAR